MADRDRMTTSNDKPVPQGMTDAEFTEKQRQEAAQQAVPQEEAARRSTVGQRSATDRLRDPQTPQEQQAQPAETLAQHSQTEQSKAEHQQSLHTVTGAEVEEKARQQREADNRRSQGSRVAEVEPIPQPKTEVMSPSTAQIQKHLEDVKMLARDLPNSEELALFTASILTAQRQLKDIGGKNEI